ncbi:MAG TPA: acetyl-CoA synthetase [Syntrophobacteraceae bacterium]|nr:acetyl-CoA synthetase [Syntrophobacteraceae bacterium]
MDVLKDYQIASVPGELALDADTAATIAARLQYPVVLKVVSPQWLHKSDLGGVRLNIRNNDELRIAFEELLSLFRRQTPSGELQGILVQKQVSGVEILMGIKRDPQLGPVVVVGMGGIYTEVFRDVARGLAPLDASDARQMLRSLRIYPILSGTRGQKGADLEALTRNLVGLSQLALDCPQISELDLNPVMADHTGCWCVDARMVLE